MPADPPGLPGTGEALLLSPRGQQARARSTAVQSQSRELHSQAAEAMTRLTATCARLTAARESWVEQTERRARHVQSLRQPGATQMTWSPSLETRRRDPCGPAAGLAGGPVNGVPPRDVDGRLRDIQLLAGTELHDLGPDSFLRELVSRVIKALQADTGAVQLLDRPSGQLVATVASGIEEGAWQGVRVPVGRGFTGRVAAERRPVVLDHVERATLFNPLLWQRGIRSMVGVPLMADGAVLGVLHVGSLASRAFTADDAALLQFAADRAALAAQSILHRAERAAAQALQQSLLPDALPPVPGVEMATRYLPGTGSVGGDWYDVFSLPSGELCLVIGDVAGSGLQAAVIMGRMRSTLRSYALETADPAEILRKLDTKMQYFEPDAMATVSCAVFDLGSGRLRISLAGHFVPIIAVPGQPTALADVPVDLPIGVAAGSPRRVTTVPVTPGTLMCLFTDGLVERRGQLLDDGFAKLCDVVTAGPPVTAAAAVMTAFFGDEEPRDDVAVLMLRQRGETGP